MLAGANSLVSVQVPARGGSIREGLVGPARFINPLLAVSGADQDLTQLVFSGLTRPLSDGSYAPDLAESYTVSDDGTTYTFHLRKGAVFQDGSPITSADVLYTIKQAQNPEIKSPHRSDWEGVSVSAPDDYTVVFTLPHAYSPFIENTSLGILPQHLWKDTTAEDFPFNPLNTHPVGTGPYKIVAVSEDSTGSVTLFNLAPFSRFALGEAHIDSLTLRLYPNEDAVVSAFNSGEINAIAGLSAEQVDNITHDRSTLMRSTLPRVFGVFLNQAKSAALADSSARLALDTAIDKTRLIKVALGGYGAPLTGPIPLISTQVSNATSSASSTVSTAFTLESIAAAKDALSKGGWQFSDANGWKKGNQTLAFSLSTADTPELVATANALAAAWRQVGIPVNVQIYSLSELNSTIIRPRNYEAILFGEAVGREPDFYAFWHSSQRNDPGLNLSLYANSKADTLLSQARATTKKEEREKLYNDFESLIRADRPAIFLYAPDFLYVLPNTVKHVRTLGLTAPSERFLNVYEWYTDTEDVWEIFAKSMNESL